MTKSNSFLAVLFFCVQFGDASATGIFNGKPLDQGDNGHNSNVFGGDERWFLDIHDAFDRDGALVGSYADQQRIGFVPPNESAAPSVDLVGQWMGSSDYQTTDGMVFRSAADTTGIACVPWRVTPNLGDIYLIELEAVVADNESVRLGYFGDVVTNDPSEGLLEGNIGQLVLDVTRWGNDLYWNVTWAAEHEEAEKPFVSGSLSDITGAVNLQLAWNEDDDAFDAWLTSDGLNHHLATGGMGHGIDVFGVGVEFTGVNSSGNNFLAAVPEPNSLSLTWISFLVIIRASRRALRGCAA